MAVRSTLSLSSVTLLGRDSRFYFLNWCTDSSPGASFQDSTVYLSRCHVQGGRGLIAIYRTCPRRPALQMTGGAVIVTGDSGTLLSAGEGRGLPSAAITATGGRLDVETNVQLFASGAAAIQSLGSVVTLRRIVSLTAAGAAPGGTMRAEVVSPAGDLAVLFVSLPVDPTPTPFGIAFVDLTPGSHIAIPFVQSALERTTFSFQMPPGASFLGWPLALQAAHLYQATGRTELSNAAVVLLF